MGGNNILPDGVLGYNRPYRYVKREYYNTKIALWHLPHDKNNNYGLYDIDKTKWFEAINRDGKDEIEIAENALKMNLNEYKVYSHDITYNDSSKEEIYRYPNGNIIKTSKDENHVYTSIRNRNGQLVIEKIFNNKNNIGTKYVHKHIKQGDNTLTVTKVYSYDTTKNKATDIINYGYTSDESAFLNGCTLEKEYYRLNGNFVYTEKISENEYQVKDNNGQILNFVVK